MSSSRLASSPRTFQTPQDELAYCKAQYEHLATELEEFQETSRELEAELEKEAELAEKREESLKTTIESLRFEVNEWKTRHKQCKSEANATQNDIQKEITLLRDSNRSLQLRLRDVEVTNDDYERQARNATSSLDDLASKCDVILERNILLEEEIRAGEQEREKLRIESQRLRDELTDMKIEAEVTKNRLVTAGKSRETFISSNPSPNITDSHGLLSAPLDQSLRSAVIFSRSIPTAPQSESSISVFKARTSPSTTSSDVSTSALTHTVSSSAFGQIEHNNTSDNAIPEEQNDAKHGHVVAVTLPRVPHSRVTAFNRHTPAQVSRPSGGAKSLPQSGSLYQIRGLMGKMQKLEERVQSVRSKLPAPATNSPAASRSGDDVPTSAVPKTVTVRRNSKRPSEAAFTSGIHVSNLERRRESVRASRTSLTGQSKGDPNRVRSRVSLATCTEFNQSSTSESGHYPATTKAGQNFLETSAFPPASSLDGITSSSDRKLAGRDAVIGGDMNTLRMTSARTTFDDKSIAREVRTLARPLRQGSQNNLKASGSGAAGASRRVSRLNNGTKDAP